jgi:hypothetical protein
VIFDMNDDFARILDDCITKIQSGEGTIDDCLQQHSQYVEALAPLLEIARSTRTHLSPQGPDETFVETSKIRVMNQIRAAQRSRPTLERKAERRQRWMLRPAFALMSFLVACTLLAASSGAVYASSEALPGDALYIVKRGVEEARLLFTLDPDMDRALLLQFLDRRLEEVEEALNLDREEDAWWALVEYENTVGELLHLANSSSIEEGALDQIQIHLSNQQVVLQRVKSKAPPQAQEALDNALERSQRGKEIIEQIKQGGKPSDLAPGQLKKTTDDQKGTGDDRGRGKDKEKTKTPKPRKDKSPTLIP